jgi:uncharacterized membrane protein YcaP (DUF421 family)
MWQSLVHMSLSSGEFIIRAVVVYLFILILLRFSGKRQMGQMGPTEFVAILLISNAVQNSMNGGDTSFSAGLLLATTLIGLSTLISYLTFRSRFFSALFEGTPTVLISKGHIIKKHLNRERMTESEMRVLMRRQGVHHVSEVALAVLESDGSFTIVKQEETVAK